MYGNYTATRSHNLHKLRGVDRWSKVVGRAHEPLVSISIHWSIDRANSAVRFERIDLLVRSCVACKLQISNHHRMHHSTLAKSCSGASKMALAYLLHFSLHRSFLFRRLSARRFRRLKIDFPLASLLHGLSIYTYSAHMTHSWQHCINF